MSKDPIANINKFLAAIKNAPETRVGVAEGRNRSDGKTNSFVGKMHEFGTTQLPVRSFLRIPIMNHLSERINNADLMTDDAIKNILKTGSLEGLMTHLGIIAEGIVQDAFDSSGFGLWPPSDMTHKRTKETLVETRQLRQSITSEVVV